MKVYPLILVLVLVVSQDVLARPGADQRQPRQFFKTLSNVINNFFGVTNAVVQSVFSAQREMIDNFLRETDNDLTAASGFMSDVLSGTQEAAEALDYIREDMLYRDENARRMARKKKQPNFKMPLPFFPIANMLGSNLKGITKFADDKLKMLVDMSSQTGKLVADTTKQISKVMKAASKFSQKVEKQKDKFEDTITKEKLKLIETTKKSLSKFLKDLSKISKDAAKDKDSGKARVILQAENELIDLTRESITGILAETARGIEGAENLKAPKVEKPKKKPKPTNTKKPVKTSSSNDKGNMISRMLKQASEKIKVFAKLTKNISKAIEKATKQKRKDLKKAQKEIQKQIKKAQKAKKKIKNDTRKDIKKIMKDEQIAGDEIMADEITPGVFNATLDNTTTSGLVTLGENATEAEIAAAAVRSTTLKPEEDDIEDEDIDDAEEDSGEDEDEDLDEDDADDIDEEEEDDEEDEAQDDEDADDEEDQIETRDLIREKQD